MKTVNKELGAEGRREVIGAISWSNWRRARAFLIVNVLVELLLIVVIDLPSLRGDPGSLGAGEPPWIPLSFHLLHLVILVASAAGLLFVIRLLRDPQQRNVSREILVRREIILLLVPTVGLLCLGIIAGLDQLRSGDTGAFTLNIMVVALLLYIRLPLNLLVFTPGFVALVLTVLWVHQDVTRSFTVIVNTSIYYAAVLIVTTFLYNNQYSQLAKSALLERANALLDHLSLHDQLTALPNRRAFDVAFERELAQMRRQQTRSFLAVCDIDGFKKLNDQYGHPVGDVVLVAVAQVLTTSVRQTDSVARWGGEEFLLLLSGGTPETARGTLERARQMVAELEVKAGSTELHCTISLGATEIRLDEADPFESAYHRSDEALYEAKNTGRNAVRFN